MAKIRESFQACSMNFTRLIRLIYCRKTAKDIEYHADCLGDVNIDIQLTTFSRTCNVAKDTLCHLVFCLLAYFIL